MSIQEIPLDRWSDLKDHMQRLTPVPGNPNRQWLFRGLANTHWDLRTTLERSDFTQISLQQYYTKIWAIKPEIENRFGKRWELSLSTDDFEERMRRGVELSATPDMVLNNVPGIYEYLVYLRHHRFPSPLLDWTTDPFVASFFAFDEIAPCKPDGICVYAILPRAGQSSNPAERLFCLVGPRMKAHERHDRQKCWYTYCVGLDASYDTWMFLRHERVLTAVDDGPLYSDVIKFTLPARERWAVLTDLASMNVNRYSLFGSEDSLIGTLARQQFGIS
jgi:hypothetical protein